jgi:hypothetical protein
MTPLEAGYWSKEIKSEYGEIEQRWLGVFSQSAGENCLSFLLPSLTAEVGCHPSFC